MLFEEAHHSVVGALATITIETAIVRERLGELCSCVGPIAKAARRGATRLVETEDILARSHDETPCSASLRGTR
jgi:hypothetical protein